MRPRPITTSALYAALSLLVPPAASSSSSATSKRGLAYLGDTHASDNALLLSANSSLAWYYTWSTTPVTSITTLPFLPLLHGLDDASASGVSALAALPASSTHLLTFNEPDGTTSSGGSAIAPSDAARVYIEHVAPLRTNATRAWNVSHPATTGSDAGLAWLRAFNASCWAVDPAGGCPLDFVAVHWYGDFAGLAAWVGTLREFYSDDEDLEFWITEMALPDAGVGETVAMMNESMAYLDGLDYVAGYAWYGADRRSSSWDGYTGGGVALFDGSGALTEAGALYLGGEEEGFKKGMKGGAGGRVRVSAVAVVVGLLAVGLNAS